MEHLSNRAKEWAKEVSLSKAEAIRDLEMNSSHLPNLLMSSKVVQGRQDNRGRQGRSTS